MASIRFKRFRPNYILLIDQLTYRSLVSGHIKIIYTVHDKYLYIHMLWDCRRNPELLQSEMKERKQNRTDDF